MSAISTISKIGSYSGHVLCALSLFCQPHMALERGADKAKFLALL